MMPEALPDHEEVPPEEPTMPFSAIRARGLLWYINRACLHPRGFALALHYPNEYGQGEPTGWSLTYAGDGQIWSFDGQDEDGAFRRLEALLTETKANGKAPA
jgi:hypothetical protein